MRVLVLATNPVEGASFRYRILAYLPYLKKSGFSVEIHSFFPSESLGVVYGRGRFVRKALYVLRGAVERSRLLRRGRYDVIVVHRELFPLGLKVFLRRLRVLGAPVIYDFDDAMFLPQRQDRWLLGKIENPDSIREIISSSAGVIAGNAYLGEYARRYNRAVAVIPTVIDNERFLPKESQVPNGVPSTIGWIGSHTTVKYLASLRGVLEQLADRHPFTLKVVGARLTVPPDGVQVEQRGWNIQSEVAEFQSCDIGIYPLWDDTWARGKCGFKAIQFMAVGVPVVASPVGVNTEIIQDGVNGFLAGTEEEWVEKLALLLKDPELRVRIGLAGRKTVEENYSLQTTAPRVVDLVTRAASSRRLHR